MGRRLQLLEVGLQWPPEPFLCRKLEALARRGIGVTVATPLTRREAAGATLTGVRLKRLPPRGRSLPLVFSRVVLDSVAVATRDAPLLAALVRSVWRGLPPGSRTARPRLLIRRLEQFLPVVRTRPDVVHFEWNGWAVDYLPLIEVWPIPVVVSCRGSAVNVRPLLPRYATLAHGLPKTFELAAAVHCVSEAMLRQAERYGLDRSKARVIRPAVDPTFFRPPPGPPSRAEGFCLAAVGMLRWQKGYEYALVAVRGLVDRGVPVRFELLGAEPRPGLDEVSDVQRLVHAIADLGLEEHVRLLGPASSEGVRDLLQRAHAFVHPSVVEGLPNVILEAMACAVPVVASDAGGTREAVRNGVEGFVVPPRDPQALALHLERLWRDEALSRRLGRAGRSRVETEFALEDQTREFEDLYHELVRNHARRARARGSGEPAVREA